MNLGIESGPRGLSGSPAFTTSMLKSGPMNPSTAKKSYRLKTPLAPMNPDADLLHKLLSLRGVGEAEKALFLKPDFETGLHNPYLLKNMQKVVDRILQAIDAEEHILIYSDFDADGLPGAAVIHDFFRKISYPHVSFFRPDRHVEGFGIHAHVLDEFLVANTPDEVAVAHEAASEIASIDIHAKTKKLATLLITIDCGIADVEPVAKMRKQFPNLDIIITDHHLPGPVLPSAYAIINPKLEGCEYPEKMLCGAAVIYKVVCALITALQERAEKNPNDEKAVVVAKSFGAGYEKWLLDLVGLATLSDMVPLLGENRLLAYYGLIVMKKTRRPGFLALAKTNNIDLRNLVEDDIVFTFSPRINVASRLADAKIAFDLLTTDNFDTAMSLAKELNNINQRRKTLVANISKQAHKAIAARSLESGDKDRGVIVIGNPDWKPPVLGLVAQTLTKAYGKPAYVWGKSDDGSFKGSVRSVAGVDIVAIMHKAPDEVFINRGGHAQSGGFNVHPDFIHELDGHLQKAYEELYGKKDTESEDQSSNVNLFEVDAVIPLSEVSAVTAACLAKLAPYGMDNPKPLFAFPNCTIVEYKMFGKEKDHLELICSDESLFAQGGRTVKAIQFFYGNGDGQESDMLIGPKADAGARRTIIGHIEKNNFRGAGDIRIRIVDVW